MKQTTRCLIVLLCGLFSSTPFAQNSADLLQKALRKERIEGDLKGAIELYQQIANDRASSRSLTAQAWVQLGKAYEKLGASEASAAYAKVVKDFSDQSKEFAEAKARLAVLDKEASAKAENPQLSAQLVASDKVDRWIAFGDTTVSPNGKYLSYINWEHGNLALYNIETEEKRDLTTEGTWAGNPDQFAYDGVWSPDSARIAYMWSMEPRGELRVVDRNGGKPTLLVPARIDPQSWSKDGKYIYALGPYYKPDPNRRQTPAAILRVDAATGATNVIKQFTTNDHAISFSLSPDGKHLAYSIWHGQPGSTNATAPDIRVVTTDGSNDRPLIEHPATDVTPVWMPNGKHVVFVSNRSGSDALWAIPVSNGNAAGEPQLIRDGIAQGQNIGVADDGTIYFYSSRPNFNIFTADADFDQGTWTPAKLVSLRYDGKNRNPHWSADGSRLGYVSWRNPPVLVFQDVSTGKEVDAKTEDWSFRERPSWSPDLAKLVGSSKSSTQKGNAVFEFDVKNGKRAVVVEPKDDVAWPTFTPDGKSLIYSRFSWTTNDPVDQLVEYNLESKQERMIAHGFGGYNRPLAVSPDGSRIAVCDFPYPIKSGDKTTLRITSRSDGAIRTVAEFPIDEFGRGYVYDWLPDNRRLIVAFQGKQWNERQHGEGQQMYLVDVETGKARAFGLPQSEEPIQNLSVHPGGKRIAFERGKMKREIWSLKNFLPPREKVAVNSQPTIRQIASGKSGPYVAFGDSRPSPDGRYLAYVNWTEGNLAVYDLQTEQRRDLTREGTWGGPDQFTFGGVWSPDSKQIAFLWMTGREGELRVIERDGSNARVLVPSTRGGRIIPYAWSKDGSVILGCSFSHPSEELKTNQILKVELATGAVHTVANFAGLTAWPTLALSPDEKRIAYDFPGRHQSKYLRASVDTPNEIRLVGMDGLNDHVLIDHPANDEVPCWMPDGRHLLFTSDRAGATGVWAVRTRDGQITGEPAPVREHVGGAKLLGATPDGSVYLLQRGQRHNVYIASVDFEAGTMGTAKLASLRNDGRNRNPRWSADGTKLGYGTLREPYRAAGMYVWQDAGTGKEQQFESGNMVVRARPSWSPDLTRLLAPAVGETNALLSIDVRTGERSVLVNKPTAWGMFTPDGRHVIYQFRNNDRENAEPQIVERNLETKQERTITRIAFRPIISPNGIAFAYITRPDPRKDGDAIQLHIMSTTDGATKPGNKFPAAEEVSVLDWLPDSRRVLVSTTQNDGTQRLLIVDTTTTSERPLGGPIRGEDKIQFLSIHPDGKRIAFEKGSESEEIWTMKNFLPTEKIAAR